jgi:glucose/arabinose dehydrogenase
LLAAASLAAQAWAAVVAITLEPFGERFENPLYVTHAGDGSGLIYVVEQPGRIFAVRPDGKRRLFLDIRSRIVSGGEMGLLGLAFHPRYRANGRFFLDYTRRQAGRLQTVISELHADLSTGKADAASERIILTVDQPYENHNGGQIEFGPDGCLYIGLGDGGGAGDPHGNSQDLRTHLGKILRINVDGAQPYEVPPDNPFAGQDAAPEIWAYGLRNPWRFSFDRDNGRLFVADVGQNAYEEVDIITRGGNYGWNVMEGLSCYPPQTRECPLQGFELPIAWYGRKEGISVTGGYVYRGSGIPALRGMYVFGDFGTSAVWVLKQAKNGWVRRLLLRAPEPISSFGQDEAGELYVVGYQGTVYKILPGDLSVMQ